MHCSDNKPFWPGIFWHRSTGHFYLIRLMAGLVLSLGLSLAISTPGAAADGPPLDGSMVKFVESDPGVPVPETSFISATGETIKLSDFKGTLTLVNFWATWCAPCVKELPAFDALEAWRGERAFKIQLVSIDRGGAAHYEPFLAQHAITHLSSASDPRGALLRALKAPGIPVTVLISPDGMVLGRLIGDAEWASDHAKALISWYLEKP